MLQTNKQYSEVVLTKITFFFRDAWVEENDRIISERRVLKSDGVQKLGQILEAQRVDEREKESLLHELHEGRQKEIDKIKERQILEQEIRKRLDFRRCNDIALDYKAKLKAKEKAEDEAWKSMIMAEAEKEAKLEQMGQQRRRMKMLELKKEADRLLVRFFFSNLYLPSRYRTIFLKMFIQGLVFKGILSPI